MAQARARKVVVPMEVIPATSDHRGHNFAYAALEFDIVGDRTAYGDFARKVRMNAAADQLCGVNQ